MSELELLLLENYRALDPKRKREFRQFVAYLHLRRLANQAAQEKAAKEQS